MDKGKGLRVFDEEFGHRLVEPPLDQPDIGRDDRRPAFEAERPFRFLPTRPILSKSLETVESVYERRGQFGGKIIDGLAVPYAEFRREVPNRPLRKGMIPEVLLALN